MNWLGNITCCPLNIPRGILVCPQSGRHKGFTFATLHLRTNCNRITGKEDTKCIPCLKKYFIICTRSKVIPSHCTNRIRGNTPSFNQFHRSYLHSSSGQTCQTDPATTALFTCNYSIAAHILVRTECYLESIHTDTVNGIFNLRATSQGLRLGSKRNSTY